MATRSPSTSVAALALSALLAPAAPAFAQATVAVDASADNHPISPLIYGVNFASAAQISQGRIPLTRWGGNSTSRYNYQIDVTNTGSDYYFENIAGCWNATDKYCAAPPKDPLAASGANAFLDTAKGSGLVALLTVPTIGWVAKAPPRYAHPFDCGCPKSANAQQDSFDPFDTNCGNGQKGGQWIQCPPATTTSLAVDATWTRQWVKYLTGRLGPSNGTRIYALDNEPNLWSSTHHDVHPARLTYAELWQRMRDHAIAILDADPTGHVAGPAEWGWPNYFCSDADDVAKGCFANSPDRATHGGEELMAWLLDQARAYEQQNNRRLLHYLDLHYYPQGGNPPQNVRSLWDPGYTDPSWINAKIKLIPRMRDWAAQHYPGTKLMVSEYDWGHHNDATGAITYAEVLGVFGREGLDGATAWSAPAANEAAFGAYKLYRNYDGNGGRFESTSARATVTGNGVAAFAAFGGSGMTVVLVNEAANSQMITVSLAGFTPGASARWFTGNSATINQQPDVAVAGKSVAVTLGATSFGLLAIPGQGPPPPDMAMAPAVDMASPLPVDMAFPPPVDKASPPSVDMVAPPPVDKASPLPVEMGSPAPIDMASPPPADLASSPAIEMASSPPSDMGSSLPIDLAALPPNDMADRGQITDLGSAPMSDATAGAPRSPNPGCGCRLGQPARRGSPLGSALLLAALVALLARRRYRDPTAAPCNQPPCRAQPA